jgi:hypothetical protein
MKAGLSLTELAKEIERRANAKKDFVAPVSKLKIAVGRERNPIALLDGKQAFAINKVAHEQFADYAGIPMAYYRRMLDNDPDLLAHNVNRWIEDKKDERRMVRTMDGTVRAVLSDKFRALENEDLAEAILPVLMQRDLMIMSCQVTESRLYIKAVDRKIERDVPTGRKIGDGSHVFFDTLSPAITVSNSEVGRGSLLIETGIFTKMCTNLATFETSLRKFHTGSRAELSDQVYALLTDKTKRLTDAAVWAQTRDLVAAAFDEAKFKAVTDRLEAAVEDRIPKKADVVEVIERVGRKLGIAEGERKGILQQLIEDGDLTRYGIHSAITRYSADVDDYDRATDLERAGAKVITLNRSEWQQLAEAA